jgi:hypothetical protein
MAFLFDSEIVLLPPSHPPQSTHTHIYEDFFLHAIKGGFTNADATVVGLA